MPKKIQRAGKKRLRRHPAALHEDSLPYCVNGNGNGKKLNVLDPFAGAGGFSLGFELAGCRVVGGIEVDSWASQTFAHNHKDALVITRDIQSVKDEELRELFADRQPDILLGGPPCQGFSICLKNAGDPTASHYVKVMLNRVFEKKISESESSFAL
jgi:site-specific DNA-cytosine methylase